MRVIKFICLSTLCLLFVIGCATSAGKKTKWGAGIGAAVGAGVGAALGARSGNAGKGALAGAAVGGLFGTVAGNRLDKQAEELAEIAETRRTEDGIVTKLQGDILFSSGKDQIQEDARMSINRIAEIVRKYPEDKLKVIGHTDSDGSNELNAKLSQKRAESVRDQLVKGGVPADVINTYGMGESQPVASNTSKDGKQLNRRVEIEISIDEDKVPKK